MEAIRVEMQHMAEAISELEKIQTESPKKSQDDITFRFHFVKESLGKITETYDSTVKKLEKTADHSVKMANETTKIAVQASITLVGSENKSLGTTLTVCNSSRTRSSVAKGI
jgi:hypothetical protein